MQIGDETIAASPQGASTPAPLYWHRVRAAVSRVWRWEFWPMWLFYLPMLPWVAYLAIRHRGLTLPTAANPGIPHGGVVGESKFEILNRLPAASIVPSALIPAAARGDRIAQLQEIMRTLRWSFPLILKPDVGQRGAAVKLVRSVEDATAYLAANPAAVLAQVYHPGPCEAGVFYYRLPNDTVGRVLSITDKVFPELEGDGRLTVEELIWRHERFAMQAERFLKRHAAQRHRVLAAGERLRLAIAGNHCQGTLFRDGEALRTAALEAAFDAIARHYDGFFFGRFDVRYSDASSFREGRDFAIVELNGVASESTNLYDPDWSIWRAYRMLATQWQLLFAIGRANADRGARVTPWRELWRVIRDYYRAPQPESLAD